MPSTYITRAQLIQRLRGAAKALDEGKSSKAVARALRKAADEADAPPSTKAGVLTEAQQKMLEADTLDLPNRIEPIEVVAVTQALSTGHSSVSQRLLRHLGYEIRPDGKPYDTVRGVQHRLIAYPPER